MPIPSPRLCQLTKWPNCYGYGFNLTSERNRPGQFISSIDPESAAEAGGLKVGDRIVEVNGVNVSLENHKQVVARIKAVYDNTNLLVVDKACDDYHRIHEIVVKSSLAHAVRLSDKVEIKREEEEGVLQQRNMLGLDVNMNKSETSYLSDKKVNSDLLF